MACQGGLADVWRSRTSAGMCVGAKQQLTSQAVAPILQLPLERPSQRIQQYITSCPQRSCRDHHHRLLLLLQAEARRGNWACKGGLADVWWDGDRRECSAHPITHQLASPGAPPRPPTTMATPLVQSNLLSRSGVAIRLPEEATSRVAACDQCR